ncbi:hypothetical protein I6E29_03930 [Arcanobacterium haemolyticum]|nr:hypothetical protein [Arcanobacterium haemolyticum]
MKTRTLLTSTAVGIFLALSACTPTPTPDDLSSSIATTSADAADELSSAASSLPQRDRIEVFAAAVSEGRTGTARKTRPVDARPAQIGEVIVTNIKGDGVETVSEPAEAGDMVVRNRCEATGNEEILVKASKFPQRYGEPQGTPDAEGYQEYIPSGVEQKYFVVNESDGEFVMEAPWGELQIYKPGDAVVQNPADESDIYRIYSQSFACTYEVIQAAR